MANKHRFGERTCAFCNRVIALGSRGRFHSHVMELGGNGKRCPGGGLRPSEATMRARRARGRPYGRPMPEAAREEE